MRDEYEDDSDEEDGASAQENKAPNCPGALVQKPQEAERPLKDPVKKQQQQQVISLRADCSNSAERSMSPAEAASGAQPAAEESRPPSSAVSEQTNCAPGEIDEEGRGSAACDDRSGPSGGSEDPNMGEAEHGAAPSAAPDDNAAAKPDMPHGRLRTGTVAKAARPKRVWREGTALSAGLRLMCYCTKHTVLLGPSASKLSMSIVTGRPMRNLRSQNKPPAELSQPLAADGVPPPLPHPADTSTHSGSPMHLRNLRIAPRTPQQLGRAHVNRDHLNFESVVGIQMCGCCAGVKGTERTLSSRCMPYNHELRRGHRAPDALAAALAKRAFVRATPYLVTTARALPPAPAAGQPAPPVVRCHSARQPSELFCLASAQAAAPGEGPAAASDAEAEVMSAAAGAGRAVQSSADRFAEMRHTVMERLTCGVRSSLLPHAYICVSCFNSVMLEGKPV